MERSIIKDNYIKLIDNIISNNRVSHAYLVEVNNYEEDLKYIYDFIKMILCNISYEELKKNEEKIIHLIDEGNYPDITVISSDTGVINKSLIIDLQKEYSNKSLLGGKRIYIIKEAEKLNGYSANTILKFLEEPEEDIIAFLVTDSRYHVLETILSRCQVLSLKDENKSYYFDNNFIDFFDCIINPNSFFIKYNHYMNDVFVDKSVIKDQLIVVENVLISYLENNKLDDAIVILLRNKDPKYIINILSIIEDEIPKLDFNVNLKLWCDSLFSRLIGG